MIDGVFIASETGMTLYLKSQQSEHNLSLSLHFLSQANRINVHNMQNCNVWYAVDLKIYAHGSFSRYSERAGCFLRPPFPRTLRSGHRTI